MECVTPSDAVKSTAHTDMEMTFYGYLADDELNGSMVSQTIMLDTQSAFCNIMLEDSAQVALTNLPAHWEITGQKYYTARIKACGHTFHCSALVWHMLRNDMRCPVCRTGPDFPLDLKSSLPDFLSEIFLQVSDAQSSSSSDSDVESMSSGSSWENSSTIETENCLSINDSACDFIDNIEIEIERSCLPRIQSWKLVKNSILESWYLLSHTQIINLGIRFMGTHAIEYTGFATRVHFDPHVNITRCTQMQYQLQGQLNRRVCAHIRQNAQKHGNICMQVGVAFILGKYNTQMSPMTFCRSFSLSSNEIGEIAEPCTWKILCNENDTCNIAMGLFAAQCHSLTLQLQWQWMLEYAKTCD
jgi:hypothetical protein